jgi:hypothetical protein
LPDCSLRQPFAALLLCVACGPGVDRPTLDLPERPADAPGGDAIVNDIRGLDQAAREERIFEEVASGNVPGWLRRLSRVEMSGQVEGRTHHVTFWVTPDYLAVGSADDNLLIPLSARTAQRIADLTGGSLPTPRMVDAIWAAADLRVEPIRFRPDEFMRSVDYIERHDDLVKAQLMVYNESRGVFLAGHKLDVVITASLSEHPGEIAIYGWHRSNGIPVQSLYVGATDSLVAFSHGVRLVHRAVLVDGVPRDLHEVLGDTALAPILSAGGVIAHARYPEPGGAQ